MSKKIINIILSLIYVITLFSGCSVKNQIIIKNAGAENDTKLEDKKIKVNWWSGYGTPEREEAMEKLIEKFTQKYPDITVDYESILGNPIQKIEASIASGREPDVTERGEAFATYLSMGVLEELDSYFDNWEHKNKILPEAIEAARSYDSKDGKLYYLPIGMGYNVMWIRTDWFSDAKLSLPETWDDVFNSIRVLTDKSKKQYGTAIRGGDSNWAYLQAMMYSYSGITDYFDENGKPTINDPLHIEFIEKYLSLYDIYTSENDINYGWSDVLTAFHSSKAGIIFHNLGSAAEHLAAFKGDTSKFQGLPYPKSEKGYLVSPLLNPGGHVIYKNSKNKEAAWKLISYISLEGSEDWCKASIQLPVNTVNYDSVWIKDTPWMRMAAEAMTNPFTKYYESPTYLPNHSNIMHKTVEPAIQKVMAKRMTAEELCNMWAEIVTNLKEQYDKGIENN